MLEGNSLFSVTSAIYFYMYFRGFAQEKSTFLYFESLTVIIKFMWIDYASVILLSQILSNDRTSRFFHATVSFIIVFLNL